MNTHVEKRKYAKTCIPKVGGTKFFVVAVKKCLSPLSNQAMALRIQSGDWYNTGGLNQWLSVSQSLVSLFKDLDRPSLFIHIVLQHFFMGGPLD